ncbi:MAG: hypothetical protein M3303_11255, partial [Gemmatimonadota bacterium]|nr:hypothetical protein [Gemmatimonadota bacterium]
MTPIPAEPRDRVRFLAAVAERVPLDRVVELYLFQPIRQGGVESGVAVIAAAGNAPVSAADVQPQPARVAATDARAEGAEADPAEPVDPLPAPAGYAADSDPAEPRYTVFTAHYRHVLKGPERGRWEVSVVAEAEAPLSAVGAVVGG